MIAQTRTRTVALWLTKSTRPFGCRSRTSSSTGNARAAIANALSPPGGLTSAGSLTHAPNASGSLFAISVSRRPSHVP